MKIFFVFLVPHILSSFYILKCVESNDLGPITQIANTSRVIYRRGRKFSLDGSVTSQDDVQQQINKIRLEHEKYLPRVHHLKLPSLHADENCVDVLKKAFVHKAKIPCSIYERFGASIENMCKKNWCDLAGIPTIVINFRDHFVKHIHHPGILRENGNHKAIKAIMEAYNNSEIDLDLTEFASVHNYNIHAFNGAFKKLFRDMDPPLIPYELAAHVRNSGFEIFDEDKKSRYARELLMLIKEKNRATLKIIIELMALASQNNSGAVDQLNANGIVVCIGPSILYENDNDPVNMYDSNHHAATNQAVPKSRKKQQANVDEIQPIKQEHLSQADAVPQKQSNQISFLEYLMLNLDIFNDLEIFNE